MCGRYTLTRTAEEIAQAFHCKAEEGVFMPRYNIAPSQEMPVVIKEGEAGDRVMRLMKWGLVPHWAKDGDMRYSTINAKAETLTSKPAFRKAFSRQRCLIPADGFYEWDAHYTPKRPVYIYQDGRSLFAFAGLWDRWVSPNQGTTLESYAIITTSANSLLSSIHERMPAILDKAQYDDWLDPSAVPSRLLALLFPYRAEDMHFYPVSTYVNSPRHEEPRCIEAI